MSPSTNQEDQAAGVGLNLRSVFARAEEIDDFFRVQLEKGLFCGKGADKRGKDVAVLLVGVYKRIRAAQPEEALKRLIEAEWILLDAYYQQSSYWRFVHRFQPFLAGYYILIMVFMFAFDSNLLQKIGVPNSALMPDAIWGVPLQVMAFGAGGAILRGLYWLNFKVGRRQFRPHFQLVYYVAPWIGGLFGALVYVVVRAGLWTFQGGDVTTEEPWAVLGLAALAGYSWEWVTTWLDRVLNNALAHAASPTSSPGISSALVDPEQPKATDTKRSYPPESADDGN